MSVHIPDLNPSEHPWDALEHQMQAWHPHPKSVIVKNILLKEWQNIPQAMYQKLGESLPKRVNF